MFCLFLIGRQVLVYYLFIFKVVQFPNGQIALIEQQQENIDPQSVQHLVFEQVPQQQVVQAVEEASQAVQTESKAPPVTIIQDIQPPVGKVRLV